MRTARAGEDVFQCFDPSCRCGWRTCNNHWGRNHCKWSPVVTHYTYSGATQPLHVRASGLQSTLYPRSCLDRATPVVGPTNRAVHVPHVLHLISRVLIQIKTFLTTFRHYSVCNPSKSADVVPQKHLLLFGPSSRSPSALSWPITQLF